tara:strand:+ start:679 stop:813 length:135 start_codon:yes stop_codon:yes gene_type:complete
MKQRKGILKLCNRLSVLRANQRQISDEYNRIMTQIEELEKEMEK